jgi:hypothetical protein
MKRGNGDRGARHAGLEIAADDELKKVQADKHDESGVE